MLFKLKDNLPQHPMVKEAEKATQNTPDVYDVMVSDYVLNLQVGGAVVGTAGFVFLNFFSIQPSVAWVGFNNNLDLSNSDKQIDMFNNKNKRAPMDPIVNKPFVPRSFYKDFGSEAVEK